ncbi:hypothetical protein D3C76_1264970 [compost metagenome]
MFPALLRGRMSLIVGEVFMHVLVEAHDYIAKIHLIQKTELYFGQSIALVVIGLWCIARAQIHVPASQCSISGDELLARAEQGGFLEALPMHEQGLGDGGVGDA